MTPTSTIPARSAAVTATVLTFIALLLCWINNHPSWAVTRAIASGDVTIGSYALAVRTPTGVAVARVLTDVYAPMTMVGIVIVLALLLGFVAKMWRAALVLVLGVSLSALATHLLKLVVTRQRPPEVWHLMVENTYSMPSGHATAAGSLGVALIWAAVLYLRRPWATALAVIAAVLMIIVIPSTRVYLGVHWVSDTVCGVALGAAISTFVALAVAMRTGVATWTPTLLPGHGTEDEVRA